MHQVRIIGGRWKRTILPVVTAEGLRPTPDRVRETVFNWLCHLLDNEWGHVRCLDLFAGSGALGFEAASRGAAAVTMVEAHTPAVRELEAVRGRLQASEIKILRGDAPTVARNMIANGAKACFDVIFLDPPYHEGWLAKMLPICNELLAEQGLLYVETEMSLADPVQGEESLVVPSLPVGWKIVRADRAGLVFYHLLQCDQPSGREA